MLLTLLHHINSTPSLPTFLEGRRIPPATIPGNITGLLGDFWPTGRLTGRSRFRWENNANSTAYIDFEELQYRQLHADMQLRLQDINNAFLANSSGQDPRVWIDSGAAKCIISDKFLLHNIRKGAPQFIEGINGGYNVELVGDYWLNVPHPDNPHEKILIKNCLYIPEAKVNLLSVSQLSDAGIGAAFPRWRGKAQLNFTST